MRHLIRFALVGAAFLLGTAEPARAQIFIDIGRYNPYPYGPIYGAPGFYGMSYGVPGFGSVRSYSAFSSPFGAGYGYGYPSAGFLPGPYGVGIWRPGFVAPGYAYGSSYYNTFAVPYSPWAPINPVPVGAYAPGFGPAYGW